jgi:hypothetical protein
MYPETPPLSNVSGFGGMVYICGFVIFRIPMRSGSSSRILYINFWSLIFFLLHLYRSSIRCGPSMFINYLIELGVDI